MTAELKKTLKQQERLQTIEMAQKKSNDLKIEEAQLLANMMFSVNAIARALTEKKLEMTVAETDEQGHVLYDLDADGKPVIKTKLVQIPLVTLQELNIQRMHVIQEYHEERRKEREAEEAANKKYDYNGESHTSTEWAEVLGVSQQDMDEYLAMGSSMQDIVETLAEENLKPDEKQLIRDKVQEAVDKAKAAKAAEGGNGKCYHGEDMVGDPEGDGKYEVDLDKLTEDEMTAYLETGAVPERLNAGQPG